MKIKADIFQLQDLLVTIPEIGFYHTRVNKDFIRLQIARKYNIIVFRVRGISTRKNCEYV